MREGVPEIHHMNLEWWERSRGGRWDDTAEQGPGRSAEGVDAEQRSKIAEGAWCSTRAVYQTRSHSPHAESLIPRHRGATLT